MLKQNAKAKQKCCKADEKYADKLAEAANLLF